MAGWNADQTTRALLPYDCGWTLPVTRDPSCIEAALGGRDPEWKGVVIQREKRFPPEGMVLPPYRVAARTESPTRRVLELLEPKKQ